MLNSQNCSDTKLQLILIFANIAFLILEAVLGKLYKNDKSPAGSIIGLLVFFVSLSAIVAWRFLRPNKKTEGDKNV